MGLFGRKPPKPPPSPTGLLPLSPAVKDRILATVGAHSIPPMPAAAQRAFQLSVDPNAAARDFVEVIASDEGLSAKVLKISNSVFFDRGTRCETIDQAVTVIGLDELKNILNATTLSEIFPTTAPLRGWLWLHDVATAVGARTLANRMLPRQSEFLFLAGLMHDIGKLLLVQRALPAYKTALGDIEVTGKKFPDAESEVFPFDHTEVGQLIAERWNFSSDLTAIIRRHHEGWDVLGNHPDTLSIRIVKAADIIAHGLALGEAPQFTRLHHTYAEELPECGDALGIPERDFKDLLSAIRAAFDREKDLYDR